MISIVRHYGIITYAICVHSSENSYISDYIHEQIIQSVVVGQHERWPDVSDSLKSSASWPEKKNENGLDQCLKDSSAKSRNSFSGAFIKGRHRNWENFIFNPLPPGHAKWVFTYNFIQK